MTMICVFGNTEELLCMYVSIDNLEFSNNIHAPRRLISISIHASPIHTPMLKIHYTTQRQKQKSTTGVSIIYALLLQTA